MTEETDNTTPIFLKDGQELTLDEFKKLEKGTVLELILKSPGGESEVKFLANFNCVYTGEGCPKEHENCCMMFQLLEDNFPEELEPWLRKYFFNPRPAVFNFMHVFEFYSIQVLSSVTIKSSIIAELYRERDELESKIESAMQILSNS